MICLDLDGVCADTSATLRTFLCTALGLEPDDIPVPTDYYDMQGVYPAEHREQVITLTREAFQHNVGNVYSDAEPLPYAPRIASILHGWGLVAGYVTRRPASMLDVSETWLEQRGFPALPLVSVSPGDAKSRHVDTLGARGIIEDSPRDALEVAQAGHRVVLIDWPYNRKVKHAQIQRADKWARAAEHVLAWPEVRTA